MIKLVRAVFALSLFMVAAPLVGHADTVALQAPCQPGSIFYQGFCYTGTDPFSGGYAAAPEIHLSSSIGGVVLLLGGMLVLRGRKAQQR